MDPAVLANATLVGEIVIYHIISGSFPASALTAAHTIAQSSLNTTDLVHLLRASWTLPLLYRAPADGNSRWNPPGHRPLHFGQHDRVCDPAHD